MATEDMTSTCARINAALLEQYGLPRPLVYVASDGYQQRLALVDADDPDTMHNFALLIEHFCSLSAAVEDRPAGQLRLF
jgi:hypothetical protein